MMVFAFAELRHPFRERIEAHPQEVAAIYRRNGFVRFVPWPPFDNGRARSTDETFS
jgi:hypothetical protein